MTRKARKVVPKLSTCHALAPLVTALVLLSSNLRAGETIVDKSLGFTLSLPEGFVAKPDLIAAAPDIAHAFVLGDLTDDQPDIMLFIERMGGVIPREPLSPEQLPPGFQGRLFTMKWQGFDVDAFEVPEQLNGVEMLTYNVQIPLKHKAIQVKLFGPADREAELRGLLSEILAGLEGESNWIPSAVPSLPVTESPRYGIILLAGAVMIVLGGLVVLWLISRTAPKGAVLVIAVGIWIFGMMLSDIRIREIMLFSGAMKMLGIAGGILGIIDLVRKRKSKRRQSAEIKGEE